MSDAPWLTTADTKQMLPWFTPGWLWSRRCKERFVYQPYRGRCDLTRGHSCAHAAERGMEIVRWWS